MTATASRTEEQLAKATRSLAEWDAAATAFAEATKARNALEIRVAELEAQRVSMTRELELFRAVRRAETFEEGLAEAAVARAVAQLEEAHAIALRDARLEIDAMQSRSTRDHEELAAAHQALQASNAAMLRLKNEVRYGNYRLHFFFHIFAGFFCQFDARMIAARTQHHQPVTQAAEKRKATPLKKTEPSSNNGQTKKKFKM